MSVPSSKSNRTAIYGSVSTSDVALSIKALLAENEEASKVVISDEDVKFIGDVVADEDVGRVKHIGEFQIDIQVKGAATPVRRLVRVLEEKSS